MGDARLNFVLQKIQFLAKKSQFDDVKNLFWGKMNENIILIFSDEENGGKSD